MTDLRDRAPRRSPLAFVVLALLAESPMHIYRMQHLIKHRAKDKVVNIAQRNSIHQTLDRLQRDGYVTVRRVEHHPSRPKRTVYAMTDSGRELFQYWMHDMLSVPAREFPEFPAALSFLGLFSRTEVSASLKARARALDDWLARARSGESAQLPRVFLIEEEYKRAMVEAELAWIRSITEELDVGTLNWDTEELLRADHEWNHD